MRHVRDHQQLEHFDRWAASYEQTGLQRSALDHIHRAALDCAVGMAAPAVVLDIGCGTGRLLRSAHARWPYARLIGVDPSRGMLDVARRLTPDADFYSAEAEALPLPDGTVDLALSTISAHHWRDQAAGIREAARVLRPGGRFVLADAAPPMWLAPLVRSPRFLSSARREALFAAAGLRVVAERRIFGGGLLVTAGERSVEVRATA
jgi:ubiquinone/menaquinone biosynthesis C-methylase UbiE